MNPPVFFAALDPLGTGGLAAWRSRLAGRQDLVPVLDTGKLAVYVAPGTRWVPLGEPGIVVGDLFAAGSASRVAELSGIDFEAIGRTLADHYWGDHVAIAASEGGTFIAATRAPTGGVHAFRARSGALTFLSSHVEILVGLDLATPSIAWDFAAHHLAFSHLHVAATGIAGIDEILPGETVTETGHGARQISNWSPWRFAEPGERVADIGEAARIVREAVLLSVDALVEPGAKLALELSGGLDSSIIAAALAAHGRSATAINLVTPSGEGDERDYARAVSEAMAIPLVEVPIEGEIDLTLPSPHLEARPGMLAMLRLADKAFADLGRDREVSAFVNGTGGDCVFCSLGSSAPVADRLRTNGARAGIAATVRDVARVNDSNAWEVMRLAVRRVLRRRAAGWRRNGPFLREDRLPASPSFHPWLDEPRDTLDGTRAHVHAILASYAHLDGYGRHAVAPSIFPLLAQPVVEACLRVPSWCWVAGGRDRAVARTAFRAELPRMVAERRTKGAMDAFCARTFEVNRERLRPFLLDGLLAGAGLLDRSGIESYLARPFANRDQLFYRLLPIIDTELWARGVVAARG